jgi:hypothetical protein
MAPKTTHDVELYEIGGGILYLAPWVAGVAPASQDYYDVGNASNFSFTVTVDKLEHKSFRGGSKSTDKVAILETGYTLKFTLDELSLKNLAVFVEGTIVGSTIHAGMAAGQEFAVKFQGVNATGEAKLYEFWKVQVAPEGDASIIGLDKWKELGFAGTGLLDIENHSSSPLFDITVVASTTS